MTWRLRFYDEAGVEIGYVEKPDKTTYKVYMTHPDSGWTDFKTQLQYYKEIEDDRRYEIEDAANWFDFGPRVLQLPPEKHLREVQERVSHPEVVETTLKDE